MRKVNNKQEHQLVLRFSHKPVNKMYTIQEDKFQQSQPINLIIRCYDENTTDNFLLEFMMRILICV